VIAKFTLDKEAIERATRSFIDTSFKKLRSAEGAFELLQNFKSIKSEGAINRQMMDKFNDILAQFSREIDATRELFELRAQAPPATRNQPPVAGAISWARSLFGRVRKTMQKLDGDLLSEEAGHEVHKNYVSLAKQMLAFEKSWFGGWSCSVDQLAMTHLKQSILRRESDGQAVVNFHPDLTRIMRETRYLDRMSFKIPEMALNITLQVGTWIRRCVHPVQGINVELCDYGKYRVAIQKERARLGTFAFLPMCKHEFYPIHCSARLAKGNSRNSFHLARKTRSQDLSSYFCRSSSRRNPLPIRIHKHLRLSFIST
jgi:dynein heavy chain